MPEEKNLEELFLKKGNSGAPEAVKFIQEDRVLLLKTMDYLKHPKAKIHFAAAKTLLLLSEQIPELIYPHFDFYCLMMNDRNKILKWIGIDITANLASVDYKKHISEETLHKLFRLLKDSSMITAGHAIDGLQKIAVVKPDFTDIIVEELLAANHIKRNPECMNITTGHLIDAFSKIFEQSVNKKDIIELVLLALKNRRSGTRKKAERFLKKYKISY